MTNPVIIGGATLFSRTWGMVAADTFDCPPIGEFVCRYLGAAKISVDPFARNNDWATITNDLNPATRATYHLDAREFLAMLKAQGVRADVVLCAPPYSQVQVARSYQAIGKEYKPFGDDNNAVLYRQVRDAIADILQPRGVVLSFGWNSTGMGKKRGFALVEVLLVCHGGAHNDTICVAERRIADTMPLFRQGAAP